MLKSTKKTTTLSLLLVFGSIGVQAQSGTLSSGGDGSGSGGSVSYSIGLTGFETSSSQSGSIVAGLQHTSITVITGLNHQGINLVAEIYPNPAVNNVTLKVDEESLAELNFVLLDIAGTVVHENTITSSSTSINLTDLASSTFLLKVFKKNQEIKTFKIVKN